MKKLMFGQLSRHTNKISRKLLCCFRKAPSTQHALFRLLQLWYKALDNSEYVDKAYGCHSLWFTDC